MSMNRKQTTYGALFLITVLLLAFAYYLEYWHSIQPCPLCLLQRFCFYALAVVLLVAFATHPKKKGHFVYAGLIILFALMGIIIAVRQLYLQHLPPGSAPACAADITFLLQTFSLTQTLSQIFQGSAECAVSQWSFLHLDMAGWALIWYLIFIGSAISLFITPNNTCNTD